MNETVDCGICETSVYRDLGNKPLYSTIKHDE
jgi:hypothetical protein